MRRAFHWSRCVRRVALLLSISGAACLGDASPRWAAEAAGVGEPQNGFPIWQERTVLVLTNRARADPARQVSECNSACCPWAEYSAACYPPVQPLVWDYNLNRSSRFQSTFLGAGNCALSHPSCCTLAAGWGTSGCNGDPSCACATGTFGCSCCQATPCTGQTTDPFTRIDGFGTPGCAENIAAGAADPTDVFHLWIDECAPGATCAFAEANGHRWNMLTGGNTQLGVGYYPGGSCYTSYYTMDFGCTSVPIPEIVAGTHYPQSGASGASFTFWVNYYDGANGPQATQVLIDGQCQALTLDTGTPANGTWTTSTALSNGCHEYYYLFRDGAGGSVTYPTVGSLTIAVGTASCATDYVATQSAAACGSPDGSVVDAGLVDAGITVDSGSTDSGTEVDAAPDAETAADAGSFDSGSGIADAALSDGGAPDAGSSVDSGPPGLGKLLGGCGCGSSGGLEGLAGLLAALVLRQRKKLPARGALPR
jgi:hypothetical protein